MDAEGVGGIARRPAVVQPRGQGRCVRGPLLLVEGDVPDELQAKARLAASNCPEYAIKILES